MKSRLLLTKEFIFSTLINLFIYYFISFQLYGGLIFDPRKIYNSNIKIAENIITNNSVFESLINLIKTGLITVFGLEFGLIWCSPILFIGIFYIFKNFRSPSYLLVFLCYGQLFYIVHLWQSAGSSYGFRYLYL